MVYWWSLMEDLKDKAEEFEVSEEWAKERRISYLNSRIAYYKNHQTGIMRHIRSSDFYIREFIFSSLADSQKEIVSHEKEKYFINNARLLSKSGITEDMIQRAKEYPIEQLLEVKKGKSLCINHAERNPSMNCKNNFAYCHACGYTGDVIDIKMKLDNLSFVEAIRRLNE